MPYTPDATDVTNPIAGTVKAATAASEFQTIKLYMRDVLLAGLTAKAPIANPTFTGTGTFANLVYTGTLTGSTGIMNIGAGQLYKDASGNVGIGGAPTYTLDIATANARAAVRPSLGTNSALFQAVNTGGTAFFGLDSSAGGLIAPYALCLYHVGAYPIGFATNNVERMRIDASGNNLLGTSSLAGSVANTATQVAGAFRTAAAILPTVANNTPTAAFAVTVGLWEVYAYIGSSGAPALYTATARVMCDGSGVRIVADNGTNLTLTLSGLTVQITQTSGVSQSVNYVAHKIL